MFFAYSCSTNKQDRLSRVDTELSGKPDTYIKHKKGCY